MNAAQMSSRNGNDHGEIRFLIDRNADGIIVVDADGLVVFANPAAEAIFGRSVETLLGSPIGIPLFASEALEITIHQPDGDPVEAEVRVVDTIWNHRPARLASLRDVSARRAIEERLRHSAKMEAVGRLTAGIAHDFNNLLTVVLGNLESAQRRSASGDASLNRALDNAKRAGERAARLTGRLLAFARRKPLEPRVLDINALVSGMSDLLQRTLGEEIEVRTALAPNLWPSEVDPTELEAAILNLAVNARDAMPSGGSLVIETANVEFDAAYGLANADAKAGEHIVVSVADSGIGMAPEVLKQVFEPFFTTKGGRGTGLGLSQVYGFVAQSGGHVRLYSEPGLGTTAKLFLPKAQTELGSQPQVAEASEPHLAYARPGETILLVEDDSDVRTFAATSLRELGYRVFEAIDGAAALEVLDREPEISLLFTDLGLPGGLDGKALAERARQRDPSLKVLFTTAYAAVALIHDGRLDAGVDLLSKPFSFAALATRIRDVLDRKHGSEGVRILLVEDEELVRAYMVELLAESGWEAEEARSFQEGLTKFTAAGDGISAAIVDLGLPDRRGDELIREIRKSCPELPVILATGYASDVLRKQMSDDKYLQILEKPFDLDRIRTALSKLGVKIGPARSTNPSSVGGLRNREASSEADARAAANNLILPS
jgi:signal transduction histidine kinase/CheY-like chemotaxis protein